MEPYSLSEIATNLGKWITANYDLEERKPLDREAINKNFPNEEERRKAIGELEKLGLIETTGALGVGLLTLRPKYNLFRHFAPDVFGASDEEDAAKIAQEILNSESGNWVRCHELCKKFDWPVDRMNSALQVIDPLIEDGRKSREIGEFVIRAILVAPEDREMLRAFVSDILGEDAE